jgi:tRNA A-37 threonylcarbamoyl transferase component Bud32
MAIWKRIARWLGQPGDGGASSDARDAPPKDDGEPKERDAAVEALHALAEPGAPIDPQQIAESVEALRAAGRELQAVELLGRALRARPDEEEIVAALAFVLAHRLDFESATPLLERLTRSSRHGLAAELLLGERAEGAGDAVEALRRYERVLARDVTHSQALNRAKRLRAKLGSSAPAAAQATVVQPEGAATKGRYELVRELGRGGSAAVYLAMDRNLRRQVALKVYHPQVMREDGRQQLAREAALPARLLHPGIVRVLDVEPKTGVLAMELVAGGSLKDLLKKGSMNVEVALGLIEAVCRPLAALHDQGIVHRDIKPGNILIRSDGVRELVLTDLSIALLPGEAHRPGVGTVAYMAPEQRTETSLDARADVYSVGVMLAAMLGGYPGPTGAVGDLLDRCLSENPGGRPRDARELGQMVASIRGAERHREQVLADLKRVAELAARQPRAATEVQSRS